MAYNISAATDNCYEGTTCLINKLNIREEQKLSEVEAAYTLAKISYLELHPVLGDFDLDHWREIHRFLFSDLYEWAGELRRINLSKKGTVFVSADKIEECATACFDRIRTVDFSQLERLEQARELADFYSTLNLLHPFREGNGRTQRLFFSQWLRSIGLDIDFSALDPDLLMFATIRAAQGISDNLIQIFFDAVVSLEQSPDMGLIF